MWPTMWWGYLAGPGVLAVLGKLVQFRRHSAGQESSSAGAPQYVAVSTREGQLRHA
ncbi:hypothetical protein H257_07079 [Aphanomyces astaci]|uniref:Uncharacterized protein n=1 Tax=Aphanomyces astaci TaxID=112090 RepID=W4GLE5_APHAT|nr:hypothetical protein H257_07079 [Aphanomyces astaci]ETV79864.1 hypothetical protein H257_07079 [Aphanomyces astaci]|eukprot:XP_009830800.1 hypothetical protein H257_07079 [Aphanomyces astaci]